MEKLFHVHQKLFFKEEEENKIQNFDKFHELKRLMFKIKDLISEGNSFYYQTNFLKIQTLKFKDYEEFIESIKKVKNSSKLKK